MTDRLLKAAAFGVLAIAGCGGASHSSSSPTVLSEPTATPSTTAATPTHTESTKTTPKVTTAPPPTPPGTPPAPAGLRQTTGYATYELCAGRCTGAVPASLRRPLHLARIGAGGGCPASGGGLVKPLGTANVRISPFVGSAWAGARVTWVASTAYHGPFLIRGRRIDAGGAVGFGEGHTPYDELQLLDSGQGTSPPPGGREWITFTRARGPGCYAYQVDGTSFTEVIVFRVSG